MVLYLLQWNVGKELSRTGGLSARFVDRVIRVVVVGVGDVFASVSNSGSLVAKAEGNCDNTPPKAPSWRCLRDRIEPFVN